MQELFGEDRTWRDTGHRIIAIRGADLPTLRLPTDAPAMSEPSARGIPE